MCVLYLIQSCNTIITETERKKNIRNYRAQLLFNCVRDAKCHKFLYIFFLEFIRQLSRTKGVIIEAKTIIDFSYFLLQLIILRPIV